MIRSAFNLILLVIAITAISGCKKFFGEKTDLGFIEVPDYNATRQIAYVPILPVLDEFIKPTDVCIGFDELIYVVDNGSEEVIAMDQAGRIVGRKYVQGAKSVVQDRAFDLLVIGTFDTTLINGTDTSTYTFSTVYRIDQFNSGGYQLNNAQIVNKAIHPFYTGRRGNMNDQVGLVELNKIAVIADNDPLLNNRYYVTRSGAGNSGTFTPNDAVLLFSNQDEFISSINVTTSTGVFNDYFQTPVGITTLSQPPQLTTQTGRQFIYASAEPGNALKVQFIDFFESEFSSFYRPVLLATGDTSQADGAINQPGKFNMPYDVTVTGDGTEFIFVVDIGNDSLYQFTSTGYEGVLPPAASGIDKYQKASFGGTGSDVTQFRDPMGVAYFNKILYVADAGNGRVLRFKLTTDFD